MFVVQNKNLFLTNNEDHNLDTRERNNLYLPQANLTIYQKGAYYLGIQIFNNLPLEIKNVAGNKTKKMPWKNFYTIEECLSRELRTVSQDFNMVVFWFKVSVYVHYVSTLKFF